MKNTINRQTTLNVRLYGTDEEPVAGRRITTGQLSLMLHAGALRYISIGEKEVVRGIAFVVRDENWGTFIPNISGLKVDQHEDGIRISYRAECRDDKQALAYAAVIELSPDGSLEFVVSGAAKSSFLTNRTGFVVLHPIDGIAGKPVTVTHTDGSTEHSEFPGLIKPSQPFFDIRELSHEVIPGVSITLRMEGDAYEMEDQRNYSDASFKTYIRPLSRPHPFTLEVGRKISQRVVLSVAGSMPAIPERDAGAGRTVSIKEAIVGRVPEVALAVHPDYAEAALAVAGLVKQSRVGRLVCTFDASLGHGVESMAYFKRMAEETGARLILEAVLPLRDDDGQFTDDLDVLEADISTVKRAADLAGAEFAIISASPACYLKYYQPDGNWPSTPPLQAVYAALRQAFPETDIAGGMHSFFTELNRFPPPVDVIDIITHSTCPIVHEADDISVMESLQALPWIFQSVHRLAEGKPYWIGPTAIAMRMNPYGAGPVHNPRNARGAMAEMDPRQRGLFNAAWTLAYVAHAAAGGVAGLCLSSPSGPNAIAWQRMDWEQPWFDEQVSGNAVFPVYHVIAGLASRVGATVRAVDCPDPTTLATLAIESADGRELWLANLTAKPCCVYLDGIGPSAVIERLDAETFQSCCLDPDGLASTAMPLDSREVTIDAYAVIRISSS